MTGSPDGFAGHPAFDAIILAGGRGSRLGGVDKGAVRISGRTLLDRALDAVGSAARVVVVGDGPVPEGVLSAREEPAFVGPAAAVVAGLHALRMPSRAPRVLVLACDVPGAAEGVGLLMAACAGEEGPSGSAVGRPEVDGWCLAEPDGRLQWLFGLYRVPALERAAEALGDPSDRSMGRLLGDLHLTAVPAPWRATADIDTPEDLQRWTS